MKFDKPSKRDKKNSSEDLLLKWWKRNKTLIAVLSAIIPFTAGFNIFLYQFVVTPLAEKRILEAEIEFIKNAKDLKEYYEGQIKDLKNIIENKENELQSLRIKLARLQNQGFDQREIELLKQEIALKENEIKFYKDKIAYLTDQLEKAKKLIEILLKSKRVTESSKIDSVDNVDNKEIDTTASDVLAKEPAIPKILRNRPTSLSEDEVKSMLKKHNFFCREYIWNTDICNPTGKGFNNDFVLIKGGQLVHDRNSGLMWQHAGSSEMMNYENAKKWIEELNQQGYAGYKDWRLPTLEEAMSLVEPEAKKDRHINPIFDSEQWCIWTADLYSGRYSSGESGIAWMVFFDLGNCYQYYTYKDFRVRAVRSVHSFQQQL